MKALEMFQRQQAVTSAALVLVALGASPAVAGPVVREATGANAAAVQAVVDAFRTDLGNPNNGNAAGSQPVGRREVNWDGGGAAATPTITPSPMTTFANRGSSFFTPGVGFEISGAPLAELGEINATYPTLFASFSSPRIFTALNTNVLDVVFHVPGNTAVAAASTGFGAVFTDVNSATSTKMEFYTPDGELLFERSVLATAGNETFSFLGVSFNAGELVGRVRIISGNAALGPDETGNLDLAAMDDFFFGEPVATAGLSIVPNSGRLFRTGGFDLVLGVQSLPAALLSGTVRLDGADVTQAFLACIQAGNHRRRWSDVPLRVPSRLAHARRPCLPGRAELEQPDAGSQRRAMDGRGQHRALTGPLRRPPSVKSEVGSRKSEVRKEAFPGFSLRPLPPLPTSAFCFAA